jgi:hypothetical protein
MEPETPIARARMCTGNSCPSWRRGSPPRTRS